MKLNTLLIAASVLVATLFAGSAMADTCKDVNISVKNDGKKEIKVKSMTFEAKVDNKKRKEGLPNKTVAPGKTTNFGKHNLKGIKGYNMKHITVTYQVKCGGKWSKAKTQKDSKFQKAKCVNGGNYKINVTKTGC
jgi:hypothetical protein